MKDRDAHRRFRFSIALSFFLILAGVGIATSVQAQAPSNCAQDYSGQCVSTGVCAADVTYGRARAQANTDCDATPGNICCVPITGQGLTDCGRDHNGICLQISVCAAYVARGEKRAQANTGCDATPGNICCVPIAEAAATSAQPNVAKTLPDPLQGANLQTLIGNVIRTAAGIAGSLALLYFVYGGIMYILSGGQVDKVKAATQIIRNAAIGVILIFAAYLIVNSILGVILAE